MNSDQEHNNNNSSNQYGLPSVKSREQQVTTGLSFKKLKNKVKAVQTLWNSIGQIRTETATFLKNKMLKTATGNRSILEPASRMILPQRMETGSPYNRSSRDFELLKSERARLETFSLPPGWPVTFITAEDCAKSGFFFLQDGDKVQCAFCRGVAGEWEEGDLPSTEHRRHFPRCPFVCNLPVGNIPIGHEIEAAEIREREEAAGVDVCGPFAPVSRLMAAQEQTVRGAQPLNGNVNDVAMNLAIKVSGNGPVHPNLVTLQSRLKTFVNWPDTCGQSKETLAEAGFFYIARLDHVKCFYCDGGLRNWEPNDDPWLEHARWFPNCSFVILNKGDGYVKEVTKSKPPVVNQQNFSKLPNGMTNAPRKVTDQELRDLIDTPIVHAILEMGVELNKVKDALQRKIQQTGQPFLTTESLLEAIIGRDEYESDHDSDSDEDNDEDTFSSRMRSFPRHSINAYNPPLCNGAGSTSTSEASSSSSAEHSSGSGDEQEPTQLTNPSRNNKPPASRTPSGDSGVSTMSSEAGDERLSDILVSPTSSIISDDNRISKQLSNDKNSNTDECATSVSSTSPENKETLEEELRKLREATQCKICMDNKVEVVFLPCGHLVSCTRCATALSNCAVCRQPIKAYVKTYLS